MKIVINCHIDLDETRKINLVNHIKSLCYLLDSGLGMLEVEVQE